MEKLIQFIKIVTRWILVLPVSIIVYFIVYIILYFMASLIPYLSSEGIIIKYIYKAPISFASGYLAIQIGVSLVNSHKKLVAILVAVFMTILYLISSFLYPQSSHNLLETQIIGLFSIIGFFAGAISKNSILTNQNNR